MCEWTYLSPGNGHLKNAVPVELDAVGLPVGGVDEYPSDVRVHGDVEVRPVSYGPQEPFGGAAPTPSTDCPLQINSFQYSLIISISFTIFGNGGDMQLGL